MNRRKFLTGTLAAIAAATLPKSNGKARDLPGEVCELEVLPADGTDYVQLVYDEALEVEPLEYRFPYLDKADGCYKTITVSAGTTWTVPNDIVLTGPPKPCRSMYASSGKHTHDLA